MTGWEERGGGGEGRGGFGDTRFIGSHWETCVMRESMGVQYNIMVLCVYFFLFNSLLLWPCVDEWQMQHRDQAPVT